MSKKHYGNLWKRESKMFRHGDDVIKHQKLLKHALIKYKRVNNVKTVSTKELVDYLLKEYCDNKLIK
ncbi:MAG: hypothetical protein Ta2E_02600 [Mycoplasmoidaceae bacterium]|nr:MAG: hypothetical protein Ta2E_02600 [Mycoplasmoidaceae bacterium]